MATDSPGIHVTMRRSIDVTRSWSSVTLDGVAVNDTNLVGTIGSSALQLDRQTDISLVLSVADSIGALDALFEMTREYAIDRTAFGRPIGGFQAIKHQLADMSLALEAGKAIATAATRSVQAQDSFASEVASIAKAWIAEAGIDIAQGCLQIFAGIGFTWEHDSHLFLRRITMNGMLYGQASWHRGRIFDLHAGSNP